MAKAQPFFWGGNGEQLSYEQTKKRREVADALAAKGSVPQTFGAGLNRIGEALLAKSYGDQATASETSGADSRKAVIDALLANPNPSMGDLAGGLANDWVSSDPGSTAVIQALMAQKAQQQQRAFQIDDRNAGWTHDAGVLADQRDYDAPVRDIQLQSGQLGLEKSQLELDALRNPKVDPFAGTQVINNQLVGMGEGGPQVMGDFRTQPVPDPGFRLMTPEELQGVPGLDPNKAYQVGPDNKISEIGGGGVNVTVGGGPEMGKLSTDFGYVMDPATGKPKIDPETGLPQAAAVPGSPAALAQQQAAAAALAQGGAQLTSDVEKAGTTLNTTRSVLDLLDNSDQPTTGTLSRPFAMYSGSPAGKIRSYVSTLQSGVALGAMKSLKEASSTGATGFGALNEKELDLLISDVGALNPDTTEPEIFRETVQRIEDRSRRVIEDIKRNVSPERIQELGLQPLIDSLGGAGQSQANPGVVDFSDYFK